MKNDDTYKAIKALWSFCELCSDGICDIVCNDNPEWCESHCNDLSEECVRRFIKIKNGEQP